MFRADVHSSFFVGAAQLWSERRGGSVLDLGAVAIFHLHLRRVRAGNVSQRAAGMIQEDLQAMGPVKLKDVEKAQQGIVDIVRRLEAEGKIAIGGGGAEDAFV